MSHDSFDPYGEPPRRAPRSGEPSGWRAFDSGGQLAAPASPSPPRSRRRNPYGNSDSGGQWTGKLMDAPPTVEAPSLWPPVSEPSAPRVGAGLRPYSEPTTEQSPTLRPGTPFREPSTSENLTVGQRPPSPYREYVTGENPTIAPPARRPGPAASDDYRVPSSRRPMPDERRGREEPTPPFVQRPGGNGPPPQAADTATIDRRSSFREPATDGGQDFDRRPRYREPGTGENPPFDRQPQQRPYSAPPAHQSPPRDRFGPPPGVDRRTYPEPPTAEAATVRPGSAPPFQPSPPYSAPPAQQPPRDRFGPPGLAATTVVERQTRPGPSPDETMAMRPASAPPYGYESSQRSIRVEPDSGSMTDVQLAHAPADPPWQSRRAAEEDASFISPIRVLGTVGVIVVVIAIAGAVIWGLDLYGDKF